MIFITLGSQKFQFNRLLREVDKLIEKGIISEKVFAQIGYSDYKPKNYEYKRFLDQSEYKLIMSECDKIITHGGTGAIITAVKNNKKVIAVARLKVYKEHVDDHQLQIVEQFANLGFIESPLNIEDLGHCIKLVESKSFESYKSNTKTIIDSIESFIMNM